MVIGNEVQIGHWKILLGMGLRTRACTKHQEVGRGCILKKIAMWLSQLHKQLET